MMRTMEQCERLALEEKLLLKYMPGFYFYDKMGATYISGCYRPNGASREYEIRIDIPFDYPYEKPELFIISPVILWKHGNRGTVNDEGVSHAFHTLEAGHGGCVQICHTLDWDASLTCVKVILKAILWCEAYEGHLQTGKDIAEFLCEVKVTNAN